MRFPRRQAVYGLSCGRVERGIGNWGLVVQMDGAAMHLHIFRDKSHSGHFDLVGEGAHPWTIDLVAVAVAAMLVTGFACALAAQLVW